MDSIHLLIANSNGTLDKQLAKIKSSFERASKTVSNKINLDKVDVICIDDKSMVIPEIGIGGYTPSRHVSYLYIDGPKQIEESEIYNTLCHELHHAKRYDGPSYGDTLFDSMVFEGLATAFEDEVSGGKAFLPSELRKRLSTDDLIKKAFKDFLIKDFNHYRWFIYDDTKKLPRWAGYEMGYNIVSGYMLKNNKKASDLVLEGPDKFLEFVRGTLRGDSRSSK